MEGSGSPHERTVYRAPAVHCGKGRTREVGAPLPESELSSTPTVSNQVTPDWFARHVLDVDLRLPSRRALTQDICKALIADSFRKRDRILTAMASFKNATPRNRRQVARIALTAKALHVAALYSATTRGMESGHNGQGWPPERIVCAAIGLDMWSPLHGDIQMSLQDRSGGEQRPIWRLANPLDRARHQIGRIVHYALSPPLRGLFATTGAGGERALKKVLQTHLPNTELVLITDFQQCFLTLSKARVEDGLLLPRRVTKSLLTRPTAKVRRPKSARYEGYMRRSHSMGSSLWMPSPIWRLQAADSCADALNGEFGVLPGLPLSTSGSEVVLAPIVACIEAAAPGVRALLWVDDLIVLLPKPEDEGPVRAALAAAVRDAICGPAQLALRRRIQRFDPRKGFEVLGYRISLQGKNVEFLPREGFWAHLEDQALSEISEHHERFDAEVIKQRILARAARYEGGNVLGQALQSYSTLIQAVSERSSAAPTARRTTQRIKLYVDGACQGSPGPGGWAEICVSAAGRQEIRSDHSRLTTNNEMELTAAVRGIARLPDAACVTVFSDSRYVIDNATRNLAHWRRSGWRRPKGQRVSNWRLWAELADQLERVDVEFKWVKAHSGHSLNDLADKHAKIAMLRAAEENRRDLATN